MPTGKVNIRSLENGFYMGDNRIFNVGLDKHSILIYTFLMTGGETFHPSVRKIARKCRISTNSVTASLKKLHELQILLLSHEMYHGRISNRYHIRPFDDWMVKPRSDTDLPEKAAHLTVSK